MASGSLDLPVSPLEDRPIRIAACVLAKNEAASIGGLLRQLTQQVLFLRDDVLIDLHVVANGCTDDTAASAEGARGELEATNATLIVHDLQRGGKSRSWNRAVHDLIRPGADFLLFLDSDITLLNEQVLQELLVALTKTASASACSGYPVKDIDTKKAKSLLDRFSLAVSRQSRTEGVINGSLYLVRAAALKEVWLPDQTPGEDGFLNAMLTTHGFTVPPEPGRVITLWRPTHHYRAHRARDFLHHERRMIVGTMVNRWIFEHLWSLRSDKPVGRLIKQWNEQRPSWVDDLIQRHTRGRSWVIPGAIMFGRLALRGKQPSWKLPLHLAGGALATILTLPPAIAANSKLRRLGAAETW